MKKYYSEFTQFYPKPGWVEHDGDEIWEVTVDLPPGTYTFKFRNGECDNWNSCPQEFWEDFEGECGVGQWGDREITVSNEGFTYGPYCFDFCQEGECQFDVDVDVTFQVELTDEQMDMAADCDGVFIIIYDDGYFYIYENYLYHFYPDNLLYNIRLWEGWSIGFTKR